MLPVAIPNNIKTVLTEKGMNPHSLAKLWGKSPNHVYKFLSKETLPDDTRLKTIVDLAQLLGVPIERLITKETDGNH